MKEKKMRELGMEEMDRVSGGGGTDTLDNVEYWVKDHPCPKCGEKNEACLRLEFHDFVCAQIRCLTCGEIYHSYGKAGT